MIPNYQCRCCGSFDVVSTAETYVLIIERHNTDCTAFAFVGTPWVSERSHWQDALRKLSASNIDLKAAGPVWGWWAEFYPPHPIQLPRAARRQQRPSRGQARACRSDRNRWKRRRFVQRLRRRP